MEIIVCFRSGDDKFANALTWAFPLADYENIDISSGPLFDRQFIEQKDGGLNKYDAIVIIGNSFGILKGSPWCTIFGSGLEKEVQQKIYSYYDGFLPIGLATIVDHAGKKFIYAPAAVSTENIKQTLGIFLAMKAVLKTIDIYNENADGDEIAEIIFGGDITLGMNCYAAAYQLRVAYDAYYHIGPMFDVQGNSQKTRRLHHHMLMVKEPFNLKTANYEV